MLIQALSTPIWLKDPSLPELRISYAIPNLMGSVFLLTPFLVSPEDCGEYMIYGLLRPESKTGAYFVTNLGDNATKSPYFGDNDTRSKVWNHAVEVTGLESKS